MEKTWERRLAIIASIATIISLWFMWDERRARIEAEETAAAARETAAAEHIRADQAQAALEAEKATLRDQLQIFARDYPAEVKSLRDAINANRESPSQENRDRIRANAKALVATIFKWRMVMARLSPLMDGDITRLNTAVESGDDAAIADVAGILNANVDANIGALQAAIIGLK